MKEMAEPYPGATPEEEKIVKDRIRQMIAASEAIPEELKPLIAERIQTSPEFLEIQIVQGGSANFQIGQLGWKR
jgi:hypothetical protein